MRRAAVLAILALALLTAPATALAAAKADLVDIEDEVMCVTCKIPLNVAEGRQPDRQREFIRGLIAQGKTKQQIKAALVTEYGPNVLALPDQHGFGITAYAIPLALLALLATGLAVLIALWRRRGPAAIEADDAPLLSDNDARRLDDDLARYEVTSTRAR
ncbi:MAG: cytochrome c-type biosis protein CcmH [Solirubrobacteraceae bacterium]|jgi:cytochrome c-type biogenesis protein CcmH|nr:cytochrome c-type biosis protein CcmH [Solirubrobacteraceae bacterium]